MTLLKRHLPKSLFARAVLILVLPMILVQLVVAIIFFDRHWQEISSHLGRALAAEMGYIVSLYMEQPGELGLRQAQYAGRAMHISINLLAVERRIICKLKINISLRVVNETDDKNIKQ